MGAEAPPVGSVDLSRRTPLRVVAARPQNALTIDLEDWRQLIHWRLTGELIVPDRAVLAETEFLLETLADRGVEATFFVLGNIADAFPALIRRIDEEGHEIASHGLSHARVYNQTPEQFTEETNKAKGALEELTGKQVVGYRAAEFSITHRSLWALEILAEQGFSYDSSIYPIRGRRLGMPDFPLHPQRIELAGDKSIVEFPLTAVRRGERNLPVAGGGYFRALPYRVTASAIREVNREKRPGVVYVHPYEFSGHTLSVPVRGLPLKRKALYVRYAGVHNFARMSLRRRLTRLLDDFSFVPLRELLKHVKPDR